MIKFLNRHQAYSFILILSAALVPYLFLASYVHPIADDFTYAKKGANGNLNVLLLKEYLTWNGRYFSNILVLLNPIINDQSFFLYRLVAIILFSSTFFGFFLFTKQITKNILNRTQLIVVSLLFTLIYISVMPDIAEGFYWYTGSVTYQLASVLTLFYLYFFLKLISRKLVLNYLIHSLICFSLLLIIIGCNEIILFMLLGFHAILVAIGFRFQKKNIKIYFIFLFFCLAFSLIVILAPGNEWRASNYVNNFDWMRSMVFSLMQTLRFFITWATSGPILLSTLVFLPAIIKFSNKFISLPIHPVFSTLSLPLIIFIGLFPAYYGTGILGQHRTVNVSFFFFLILWYFNLVVWINYFKSKSKDISFNIGPWLNKILYIGLYLSIVCTNNGYGAITDIVYGTARKFDQELNQRYQLIDECKKENKSVCILPPLRSQPKCLFTWDLLNDNSHWMNNSYCVYFGLAPNSIWLDQHIVRAAD